MNEAVLSDVKLKFKTLPQLGLWKIGNSYVMGKFVTPGSIKMFTGEVVKVRV